MSEDLIERLKRPGTWARHADDIIASSATEELIRDDAPFEAAAEIERLRAKLAEAEAEVDSLEEEQCYYDTQLLALSKRAEAAEKRLASAKEVIAPFAERYREAMRVKAAKHAVSTTAKVSDLRAAAEWMEKGDV